MKSSILNKPSLYILATVLITFIVYSFSLSRGWQLFDERLFYNETLLPIPQSFGEIFEIYKEFGQNAHIESANSFFSNLSAIRSAPLNWFSLITIFYFFKTNPLAYHLFQLIIHLINTTLIWIILYTIPSLLNTASQKYNNLLLTTIFTLIWSLHSTNIEAVLLATNWNALFAFTLCLLILVLVTKDALKRNLEMPVAKGLLYCILFLTSLFFVEQIYTFPLIVFLLALTVDLTLLPNTKESVIPEKAGPRTKKLKNLDPSWSLPSTATQSIFHSLKYSLPLFAGLFIYIIIYIISPKWGFKSISSGNESFIAFIERNLWFTPQIFFHNLSLIFFPKTLSLYQSNLVHLADTLSSPYTVFCTVLYLGFLLLPILSFFAFRNLSFIFILFYAFFFALFPFLHILFPTYCLSADRYLYFPSFFLLLLIFTTTIYLLNKTNYKAVKPITFFLVIITLSLCVRTTVRISDWKNSLKLIKSSINLNSDPLYKAHKLKILALHHIQDENIKQGKITLQKALKETNSAIKKYKSLKNDAPLTLRQYGLDADSLLLKAAYLKADILKAYYTDQPETILAGYEKFITDKINIANPNEIELYARLLLKTGKVDEAKSVLEFGFEKFPYSSRILYSLIDLHLKHLNNPEKAKKYLEIAYKIFPNRTETLYKLFHHATAVNDKDSLARISYLIGLRTHNKKSLKHSAEAYLNLKDLKSAKKAITALSNLDKNNAEAMLLKSKYLALKGNIKDSLILLEKAYKTIEKSKKKIQLKKNILISLINVSLILQDSTKARFYLDKYKEINDLTSDDKNNIEKLNKMIATQLNGA